MTGITQSGWEIQTPSPSPDSAPQATHLPELYMPRGAPTKHIKPPSTQASGLCPRVAAATSCIALQLPVPLGDARPRPGNPHSAGNGVRGPSRPRVCLLHRDLQRAQLHTEGIWNPQKPFLLTEKFLFFICSANTYHKPRCTGPMLGARQ